MTDKPTGLPITKKLSDIFPGAGEQLCSRHSTLMGKLKEKFSRLYDGMIPEYFVVVPATVAIINSGSVSLSMAIENGVIVLVSRTYSGESIFVNGNHLDEEIIFTAKGQHQEGLTGNIEELSAVLKESSSQATEPFGGIMYMHCNLPENAMNHNTLVLTGAFVGCLTINHMIHSYPLAKLTEKLASLGLGTENSLTRHFEGHHNGHFRLQIGDRVSHVPLNNNYSLLFCKLDLAEEDIAHTQKAFNKLKGELQTILNGVSKGAESEPLQLYCTETLLNPSVPFSQQQNPNIEGFLSLREALEYLEKPPHDFEAVLNKLWVINTTKLHMHTEETVELVEDLKRQSKLKSCMIVDKEFLLIVADRRHYTHLLCELRELTKSGQLASKSLLRIQEKIVESRWGADTNIGERLFTTTPSAGLWVFDPSEMLWFD